MEHGNNQVKLFFIECRQGFPGRCHPGEPGRVAEIQPAVFMDDSFGEPAVLFHNPGIVGRRNQQDIPDLLGHQLMKNFKMGIKILGKTFDF